LKRLTASGDVTERIRVLEDHGRRNNIRISGLQELPNENTEQTQNITEKMIKDKLALDIELESASRIGNPTRNERPRTVIARFKRFPDRNSCLRSSAKLKGSSIYMNEDVSKATLDIRKSKMEELKLKREQGYIAYFSGIDIVSKRRPQQRTGGNAEPLGTGSGTTGIRSDVTGTADVDDADEASESSNLNILAAGNTITDRGPSRRRGGAVRKTASKN